MAKLIDCYVCQQQISNAAPTCPHCGDPRGMKTEVSVRNVDMEFGTMVVFMVKAAIAAIPAGIILLIVGTIIAGVLGGIFSGYRH